MRNYRNLSTVQDGKKSYNPDLIFASSSIDNMCVKSVLNPIPNTQHHPICVTVNPVLVSRSATFRRRFNPRKTNWSGYATDIDTLIDEVDPTPENYDRFVEAIRVISRKRIPRGCKIHYIPGLSEESKSLYEAYKKQHMSNPFDSTTLDTGNDLISKKEAGIDDVLAEQLNNLGPRAHRWLNSMLNVCSTGNRIPKVCRFQCPYTWFGLNVRILGLV